MDAVSATTPAPTIPDARDWTIAEMLDWIAADDVRCHDPGLVDVLVPALAQLGEPVRRTDAPVLLVRALAVRVAAEPALRTWRVLPTSAPSEDAPESVSRILAGVAA